MAQIKLKKKSKSGDTTTYTRKHTNKIAYEKHLAGLKKRNAKIISNTGMVIKYTFPIFDSKNTSANRD